MQTRSKLVKKFQKSVHIWWKPDVVCECNHRRHRHNYPYTHIDVIRHEVSNKLFIKDTFLIACLIIVVHTGNATEMKNILSIIVYIIKVIH